MCLGSIAVLVECWDAGGAQVGRLDSGEVVSLAFVPGARTGAHLLIHLGIPVEVLDPATPGAPLRSGTRPDTATAKEKESRSLSPPLDRASASPSPPPSSAASRST